MSLMNTLAAWSGAKTLAQKVAAILRKYGADAHVYLPGIGVINGLTAGNYLDSAGTTAATVDNPVGLVLDGAGSVSTTELATANYFTQATYDNITTSTSATSFTQTAGTTAPRTILNFATVVGKLYKVTFKITLLSAGTVGFNWRGGSNGTGSVLGSLTGLTVSSGLVTEYVTADATASSLQFFGSVAGSYFNVDTISIKEVTGIHATQGTTANKPILRRGAVNWLLYSEDVSNAAWIKSLSTTPSANTVLATAGAGAHQVIQAPSTLSAKLGFHTISVELKSGTNSRASVSLWSNETGWTLGSNAIEAAARGVLVDLSAGTILNTNVGISALIEAKGDGWYRVSISNESAFTTATGNQARVYVAPNTATTCAQTSFTAVGTETILVRKAQFTNTSVATDYIPTTTAPASSSTGNYWWQFDGSNDSLALGSVPFQMADDHCVIAGARLVSKAATSRVFCIASTSSNTPRVCDFNFQTTGRLRVSYVDDAGVTSELNDTTDRLSTTVIATARKSGNVRILKVNGTQVDTKTASLGATTVNTCSIGSLPILNPTTYMNGNIYPIIAIKGTVTDADLLTLEKFVGSLSGVTI